MRILRVLLPAAPDAARADAWALFDASGRVLQEGRDVPAAWPVSDRREAVLACDAVRVVALNLPPLPRERLIAAATYALEDRLATSTDDAVVAVGARNPDGRMTAVIAERSIVDALSAVTPPFLRAIAEPELATPGEGWRWCASAAGGFVRTDEGAAFSASATSDGTLPAELAHALAEARRNARPPSRVNAESPVDQTDTQRWTRETGVPFVAGTPWRWTAASPAGFAEATDIIAAVTDTRASGVTTRRRSLVFALTAAVLALMLNVLAAAGTWIWQRAALANVDQTLVGIAREAGVRDPVAGTAAAAIAARHAQARHRAGLAAPADAMPLLARAAPALAALPAGALRTATWSGGAWTLDLAAIDEPALAGFAQSIAAAGLQALHARTASGVRARISALP